MTRQTVARNNFFTVKPFFMTNRKKNGSFTANGLPHCSLKTAYHLGHRSTNKRNRIVFCNKQRTRTEQQFL